MTINGISYSSPKNINLQGVSSVKGSVLRFARTSSTNPLDSSSYGLYVDASGNLIWSAAGSSTTLGSAAGSIAVPSWDQLYNNDKTMVVSGTTFTIDGTHASNAVLTLTDSGAGTGHLVQITNTGTGKDINGTSDTWSVSAVGDAVFNKITAAGDADSTSLTLTAGDMAVSDGKVAITNADNEDTLAVVNNGLTSASALDLSGSGTFTGNTTSSFIHVSPSGLTTGTAMYMVAGALTTGKLLHLVGNAVSSGILLHVASSVASTTLTTTGRLFKVEHSGNASGTGTVAEVSSAAADETVIFKVTASDALAAGAAVSISASSMTTGKAIVASDLDALTTGMGIHVASSATAITTTGRLLLVNHTGVTTTSGTIAEVSSSAADETIVLALTANDLATGKMLDFGTNIALTTGQLFKMAHTTSVIADGGSMVRLSSTGINTGGATNATMLDVQTTNQVAGTQVLFKAGAVTTGVVLSLISTTGMTSGSLLRATTSTAGAVATNGVISIRATGAYTSTSNAGLLDVQASATTAGTVVNIQSTAAGQTATALLYVKASGFTTGYTGDVAYFESSSTTGASNVISVVAANSTAGNAVKITANSLTTGTGLLVTSSGTITSAGQGLVNIVGTGITSGDALKIDLTEGTLNGGNYINCYDDTGTASVFKVAEDGAITTGTGTANFGGALITSAIETIAAGGTSTALSLAKVMHNIDADAGGDTFTLADGTIGQLAIITLLSATGLATITPTNLAGGTSVTLNAAGDSVILQFTDTEWYILGGNSYAVV